jgi:hypothetical protein
MWGWNFPFGRNTTKARELVLEDMLATPNRKRISQHDIETRETIILRFEYI